MKRGRLLILLLLVALGMGLLAWTLAPSAEGRRLTLPNGDQLTFCAITVGTNTSYCYGNVFQRMAARIPGAWGDKLSGGTRAEASHYNPNNVVFWFHSVGSQRTLGEVRFRVVNDQGLDADTGFISEMHSLEEGEQGFYLYAGILPRRSRTITLRLSIPDSEGGSQSWGELSIPNPLYAKYPEWTPEALPATRSFGSTDVTLEEMSIERDTRWTEHGGISLSGNRARFGLLVRESDQPTEEWVFFGARCSDATGDFSYAWTTYPNDPGTGRFGFSGQWPLWPGEKAVMLQTLWVRKEVQPPERMVVFYGVSIPPASSGVIVIAGTNHPLGRFEVTCRRFEKWTIGPPTLVLNSSDPRFYRYEDAEVETYYFQGARDENLKPLERVDPRTFRVPADAKSVDIAIHLPKAKRADFIIGPKLISTNLPPRRE